MSEMRIGIEVGGTFTDWIVADGATVLATGKVSSTPAQPELGALQALAVSSVDVADLREVVHGSTVATNAILERKGAPTALITTTGFRDVIAIQRQAKLRLFDLAYRHPEPLIPLDYVLEADERMGADGVVRRPLDTEAVIEQLSGLVERAPVRSVAICLLHSYANPVHEELLADAISKHLPDLDVTCSSDLAARFREYERTSTTLISAYVKPVVEGYLDRFAQRLDALGFVGSLRVIQANGGSLPVPAVRRHAAKMILSGPAAGVVGATAAARNAGFTDLLTLDVGGTSSDTCLVADGRSTMTSEYRVSGLPLQLPMVDIATVGAGGGSVAWVDDGGILRVGPESAGAKPGPACYGRGGTEPTVTDAHVVLGLIAANGPFGGDLELDIDAAHEAIGGLADRLGMSVPQAAAGVRRIANVTMAQALRLVSVERGHDPCDFTLVAYGGGGPLHAVDVADELGIGTVLVPPVPGILSAYGLLIAGTVQEYERTHVIPVTDGDRDVLVDVFNGLHDLARADFGVNGIAWDEVEVEHVVDARYGGQAYTITVPASDLVDGEADLRALADRFAALHETRYGHAPAGAVVEVVNVRITVRRDDGGEVRHRVEPPLGSGLRPMQTRTVWFDGQPSPCTFIRRTELVECQEFEGPVIVEESSTTILVPRGWSAAVDAESNLVIRRRPL